MTEINNKMNFEQAYRALSETVHTLEDPNTTLEDSLKLYEQACKLVIYCQRKLADAKGEITDINTRIAKLKASDAPLFED